MSVYVLYCRGSLCIKCAGSASCIQIFQGNSDNNVHKNNAFDPPFYARFVRVVPWAWHERITLRMELLGCDLTGR